MLPNRPLPTNMKHDFSVVPKAEIPRSNFRRDCDYKTTMSSGYLYPIFFDEALPGDTFNVNLSSVARMTTPIVPVMDNIKISFFFFSIPNRLVWNNWQKFMGEKDNPADPTDFLVPQINAPAGGFQQESVYDYFGIPTLVDPIAINALHLRAMNLTWNEWFRDQNLQNSIEVPKGDGPDDPAIYNLLKRGKRHDYFTSSLPFAQKGDAVEIPLGDVAPIQGIGKEITSFQTGPQLAYETGNQVQQSYAKYIPIDNASTTNRMFVEEDPNNPGLPGIYANLADATAATINSLRQAFQLQRLLERDARGGTRYTEIIRSHFSVVSPDARLQRPEYLGGGTAQIVITPIPQTSQTEATGTEQGNLAAVGYHSQSGIGFTKSFVEHCTILGFACITCDLTYQRGLNRMWSRRTKYDFYWPALAHIGEMPVKNIEIYADGSAADQETWGYQEAWADYRYKPSLITGKMRSVDPQSLDIWHLSQDFGSTRPALNSDFIEENPPIARVLAVQNEPEFKFNGYFNVTCTRAMPMYSVPGLIDHF